MGSRLLALLETQFFQVFLVVANNRKLPKGFKSGFGLILQIITVWPQYKGKINYHHECKGGGTLKGCIVQGEALKSGMADHVQREKDSH